MFRSKSSAHSYNTIGDYGNVVIIVILMNAINETLQILNNSNSSNIMGNTQRVLIEFDNGINKHFWNIILYATILPIFLLVGLVTRTKDSISNFYTNNSSKKHNITGGVLFLCERPLMKLMIMKTMINTR